MHTLPVEKQCEIYGASGLVRRSFVILKEAGNAPEKKGPFVTSEHLEQFVREVIACRHPSTTITVCCLTWNDDLWVDDGRGMIKMFDSWKSWKPKRSRAADGVG